MKDIRLTDLMDVEFLQKMQDEFSAYTGLSALTTDENAVHITKGGNFTNFCTNLVRKSKVGCGRCEECDRKGAHLSMQNKHAAVYKCHAGIVDFATPIILEGKLIGIFMGGQVRTEDVDEEEMTRIARELDIEPELFISEAKKVKYMDRADVEKAATFLEGLSTALSEMAYHNYMALQKSQRMEKAARAQSEFIMSLYKDMHMDMAQIPLEIREVAEYINQVDGKIEIRETKYKINDLMDVVYEQSNNMLDTNNIDFSIGVDPSVPEYLLGDAGRIGQLIIKVVQLVSAYKTSGKLTVRFSTRKKSYATMIVVTVMDYESEIPSDVGKKILSYLDNNNLDYEPEDIALIGPRLAKLLLEQLFASVDMRRTEDNTIIVELSIPQLTL